MRAFAKETLQLATIAYRIGTETAADCPDPQNITGLVMHDLSSYDRRVRPAISRAFSLGAGIGVLEVVPGSAAERAGLRTDDEILSVNGVRVRDPAAVDEPRKSSRRLETFSRDLQATLSNGPAELEIRRRGAVVRTSLTGELGCGGDLLLSDSRERNAWSDGSHVVVTTAMMRLARSDDELAFVVAHEMAHNILGHSSSSKRGIFGVRLGGKREEVAADYMAVWMMTEGGYKAEGGLSFLRTVRRRLWWNVSLDHPSFGRRIRTVSGAIAMAANSPLWARAHHDLAATAKGSDQL
ncbi:MAG: M48 family metallopeptidase, partial [Sphingomicrobium sp.]